MAKMSKKELRNPDELWKASASSFRWLGNNWLWLTVLCVVLVFGTAGFLYFQQLQLEKEAEAQHSFSKLLADYEQWQLGEEESLESFESQLKRLKSQHPKSNAEDFANLFKARVLMEQGQADQAKGLLTELSQSLGKDFRVLAWFPLASILENASEWEEALSTYEKVLSAKETGYRKWALLGKARALSALGQIEESLETYDLILSEYPEAPELNRVRGLRALTASRKSTE